jgi:hypothetical protein
MPKRPERPTSYSIPEAGRLLGVKSANGAYELVRTGRFPVPVIELSPRRHRIPAAPLHRLLGLEDER